MQGCDNPAGDPTLHVASMWLRGGGGGSGFVPGSNITVSCTAAPSPSLQPLSWWLVTGEEGGGESYLSLDDGRPHYITESRYDGQHCRWTSALTITDFSVALAGEYMCSVGPSREAVRLEVEGETHVHRSGLYRHPLWFNLSMPPM